MQTVNSKQASLAWRLISAIGGALAAIVVAGVLAGRVGLPIEGRWLPGAALFGALPQLLAVARGRWAARWAELAAALTGFAAIGGVGLALAWPALLPLGYSVDAIHHTQLIAWVADHRAIPSPGGANQALLGEMAAYPIGLALLVLAAAAGTGLPLLEATYPTVALLGGLIAATVVLLSSAAGNQLRIENGKLKNAHLDRSIFNSQFAVLNFLALLAGPLLLLAHRTYLMEAYIDHSYYTMVLGVLLVLLATAWLLNEPPRSFAPAAQFGLVLAALMCTYPLWAPLPAALAFITLVGHGDKRRWTIDDGRWKKSSIVHRLSSFSIETILYSIPAFGPALALALLDVLPRMRIGQAVLAHEGLVAQPTLQRLVPIMLALPCALLAARGSAGRRLVGMAVLAALAIGALALAARGGLAAGYHSYKLLFVLTPLAAAIVGAALARLVGAPAVAPKPEGRPGFVATRTPPTRRNGREAMQRFYRLGELTRRFSLLLTSTPAWPSALSLRSQSSGSISATTQLGTRHFSRTWMRTNADERGQMDRFRVRPRSSASHKPRQFLTMLALGAAIAILALTGSFRVVPAPAAQVISPDMVAAARWLRASAPKDAGRAIGVGLPAGPVAYWLEVGLLGQQRDKAAAARRDFTIAPPTRESWLIDQQLPPVAITAAGMPLPGETTLARFGDVAVVRRAAKLNPAALNPLLIRYRSFWEDGRLKTAIELQRGLPGPLPLLDLRLYHAGAPIATYALPPEQDRTRPQYLGADLLPGTLGAQGYINQSAYPVFAAPALAPTGALSLTLRLTLAGAVIEERPLASFVRAADGQIGQLAPSSGELIYMRHDPAMAELRAADLDFGGALRLSGWQAPARAAAGETIAIGLRWQAPQAPARALFPELLILNAAGKPVAASLAAPQDGFYPTWRWRASERVDEQRWIALPLDLAPGTYQVAARVHDFAAGHMLALPGADGLARIGEIVVD